jgi:PAS domain S-box-containing protein
VGIEPEGYFSRGAPQALRDVELPFRLLVEAVEDYAIFMLEPDGAIASWNAGARRAKGYEAEEVLGRPFTIFYTPEDRAAGLAQRLLDEANEHGHASAEGWRVRKDGTRFWASVVLTALRDDDGELMGFGKVTRDISERKAYENELARSNADLEAFASIISHDLREPLQLVVAFAELLGDRLEDADPEQRMMAERILRAGRRMREMLDDVREWSRVGGAGAGAGSQEVDLAAVAAAVADSIAITLAEHGVDLVVGDLPTVRGDEPQLGQVLQNLIGNAAKFGAKRVELSDEPRQGMWVISVADDGPGVPPDQAEEIFAMFARLHGSADVAGSGIGLAVCRKVVERHGGEIWVEPRVGGGSVFRFSLPRAPAA